MKKFALISLLIAGAASAGDVVKRGDAIPADAKITPLAQVLEKPEDFTKTAVVTDGVVKAVCKQMGCWMEIAPAGDKDGVRVTFKDYGFFVPKDSKTMKAKMAGMIEIKTLSKEEADHLEHDGAVVKRNEDGTAREVSFVASGVELTK
jgi:uncharacterized protein DUF4920